MGLDRKPPAHVRRKLRREVGFGCPVPGCASPYLEYHHFDPEWHVEPHHNPEGMIALCRLHHGKAAAWTPGQLRKMKTDAAVNVQNLVGRFEWMRSDVIGLIGGNFYWNTMTMVSIPKGRCIWFEHSPEGMLLLNVRMLTVSGQPRAEMSNNDWFIHGQPTDLVSPINGRSLRVTYGNGDDLQITFHEFKKPQDLAMHYKLPHMKGFESAGIPFPLLVAEIQMKVAGADIDFTAKHTKIGNAMIRGYGILQIEEGLLIK